MSAAIGKENDDFEKGRCWTLYKYMEDDFLRFMEYVPYTDYNSKVYSPKLLAMLLQICGYIDSVFKIMAKFPRFAAIPECKAINDLEPDYWGFNIDLAREAFEKIYRLSSNNAGRIIAKLDWFGDKECQPFAGFAPSHPPKWWSAYNRVKHTWSSALEEANMVNVLDALAGAFLLNTVHYPSILLLWRLGDLKDGVFVEPNRFMLSNMTEKQFKETVDEAVLRLGPLDWGLRAETRLFLYEHKRHEQKMLDKILVKNEEDSRSQTDLRE